MEASSCERPDMEAFEQLQSFSNRCRNPPTSWSVERLRVPPIQQQPAAALASQLASQPSQSASLASQPSKPGILQRKNVVLELYLNNL